MPITKFGIIASQSKVIVLKPNIKFESQFQQWNLSKKAASVRCSGSILLIV